MSPLTPAPRMALSATCVAALITLAPWTAESSSAAQAPAASSAVQPASPSTPVPPPRYTILLDAAHGGDDLGGHLSSGQLEKSANLALGVRLRSLLAARGIQVVTTRESDQSVDLNRRAEIANHADR